MSRIVLGVLAAVSLASATTFSMFLTASGRTLEPNELWGLFGGQQIQNACCWPNLDCHTPQPPYQCSDAHQNQDPQMACGMRYEEKVYAGNRDYCKGGFPGASCTQSTQTHPCYEEWQCMWDSDVNQCLLGTLRFVQASAPDTCDDDC